MESGRVSGIRGTIRRSPGAARRGDGARPPSRWTNACVTLSRAMRKSFLRPVYSAALGASFLSIAGCDLVLGLGDYKEGNGTGGKGGAAATSNSTGDGSTTGSMGTTSSSGSGSSSSGMTTCSPGMDYDCYDGPPGTLNVGECREGTHTCKADGETYTPCVQQILPASETCKDDKKDEDCDAADCVLDAMRLGDLKDQTVGAIATDAMGNVVIAGEFTGTLAFDASHTFTNPGFYPAFYIAKLDPTGTVLFAKSFTETVVAKGLAFDSQGNVVLVGTYGGILSDVGATTLTCYETCTLLAKFDGAGNVTLAQQITVDQVTNVTGVAIGANSSIYLWGDQSCGDQCSSSNFWLQKKSSSGTTTWSKTYTTTGGYTSRQAGGIAYEPLTGHVWVIGSFKGSEALGGTAITSAGGFDVIIGEVDSSGNTVSKRILGDAADQFGHGVAVDSSANIYFTGSFAGKILAGTNNLQSNGGLDTFVLRVSSNGQYGWAKAYGGAGDQLGLAIAAQPSSNGSVVFTGNTNGSVDYGGGLLAGAGGLDAPLVKLSAADGTYLWSRLFGDSANQTGRALTVDSNGNSHVAFNVSGVVDFGAGATQPAGGADILIGRFGL